MGAINKIDQHSSTKFNLNVCQWPNRSGKCEERPCAGLKTISVLVLARKSNDSINFTSIEQFKRTHFISLSLSNLDIRFKWHLKYVHFGLVWLEMLSILFQFVFSHSFPLGVSSQWDWCKMYANGLAIVREASTKKKVHRVNKTILYS